MERNTDIEVTIGKAILQLEMALKEMYPDPNFSMRLIKEAEDNIKKADMKMSRFIYWRNFNDTSDW